MEERAAKPGAQKGGRNYLRELQEAALLEREWRQRSFADALYPAGPFRIRALNLRDLDALLIGDSPLVCGGMAKLEDFGVLIFRLLPGHKPQRLAHRNRFAATLRTVDFDELSKDVAHFLDLMFLDVPGGTGGGAASAHFALSYVDLLASQYGWTEAAIALLPLPRLYGYVRRIQRRLDPLAPNFNAKSDRVRAEYLTAVNALPVEQREPWLAEQMKGAK